MVVKIINLSKSSYDFLISKGVLNNYMMFKYQLLSLVSKYNMDCDIVFELPCIEHRRVLYDYANRCHDGIYCKLEKGYDNDVEEFIIHYYHKKSDDSESDWETSSETSEIESSDPLREVLVYGDYENEVYCDIMDSNFNKIEKCISEIDKLDSYFEKLEPLSKILSCMNKIKGRNCYFDNKKELTPSKYSIFKAKLSPIELEKYKERYPDIYNKLNKVINGNS